MKTFQLSDWLPTTKKEMEIRGWDAADVILFSGDAYVDHPSFGAAVIGRVLEAEGLRVAIVPQPDWRGDYRDFTKLGAPRLFFGIAPGAMDSMVNHYTANKRLRSDDAYTADRLPGKRPDYPTIVYTRLLKQLYPQTPVVIGGIEASMRRLAHYDYWEDRLRPSILVDSGADLLVYGMGETPMRQIVRQLQHGIPFGALRHIAQTAYLCNTYEPKESDRLLFSFEACKADKLSQAKNFRVVEEEANKLRPDARIVQKTGKQYVVVQPACPPMTESEIDASFDLPYTRLPHPKYKNKPIPAYEMIKFSVNIHRGCFGGCSFCAISAHQGKFIASRSEASVVREIHEITKMPDFKGYLSDLGGPSANMYRMQGIDQNLCLACKRPSCQHPRICPNLHTDHAPLIRLYQLVRALPGIRKVFIGSGIRYDLLLHTTGKQTSHPTGRKYAEELIVHHVSGRLKVAPEHTENEVLGLMRKPPFETFEQFNRLFEQINKKHNLNQQLIPYFISSHPGCTNPHMAQLAVKLKKLHFQLEQVQDFTPTPMTLATEIYYTGIHPYTLEKVEVVARTKEQKLFQRQFFFWKQPEYRGQIIQYLRKVKRNDLVNQLFGK